MSDFVVALVAGLGGPLWAVFLLLILLAGVMFAAGWIILVILKDNASLRAGAKDLNNQVTEVNKEFSESNKDNSEQNLRIMEGLTRMVASINTMLEK